MLYTIVGGYITKKPQKPKFEKTVACEWMNVLFIPRWNLLNGAVMTFFQRYQKYITE